VVAVIGDDNAGRLASDDGADVDENFAPSDGQPVAEARADASPSGEVSAPASGGAGPDETPAGTHGEAETNGGPLTGGTGDALPAGETDAAGDAGDAQPAGDAVAAPPSAPADLEAESEIAADYIEGLLDVADLDGDIDMDVEGDRPLVSVVGATLKELVGSHGEVLEALQELTRLAVHRQTGLRSRIMLDVGGYRARRREELTILGKNAAEEVSRTGAPRRLDAMTPFERKIVHDAVAAAGLRSESEGEEPERRVVVFPAG
jgi:spoIIIJ-associated protein